MNVTSISQALLQAQALGLDRLDAQWLLLHAMGRNAESRAWLLSHDADPLPPLQQLEFDAITRRRMTGEPLAYITGHKEFFGLDLLVDARVLVPRPDTETLVEWALGVLPGKTLQAEPLQVLDLGTGSGAIALALKASRPDLAVSALDYSEEALSVARENARRLHLDVQFRHGSWLDRVPHRYHAIVSNPPYIAAHDEHLNALRHEPRQALVSGPTGLNDIRCIIEQAPPRLHQGCWLLLEHGHDQAEQVRRLLQMAGFSEVRSMRDLGGIERCSGGRAP